MRKLFTIIVYTIVMLLIGRNLSFLPRFYLFSSPQQQHDAFTQKLKTQTQQLIKDKPGIYGIAFADLTADHSFGMQEKRVFTAASLNKVPIVAVLYWLNNKGKIDLDEKVTLQKNDIQAYGTGSLQYQEPGVVYSFRTLAQLALQQSDNTAAYVIDKRIGTDVIQQTINSWGLTQTDMENNKTSPHDMYLLFKKIYKGEITTVAKTQELFGFMIDTDIEDRLSADLPEGTSIYHKTGDAVGSMHDVGIIQKDGAVFFIAMLTDDIGQNETETKQTIAAIAKTLVKTYDQKE